MSTLRLFPVVPVFTDPKKRKIVFRTSWSGLLFGVRYGSKLKIECPNGMVPRTFKGDPPVLTTGVMKIKGAVRS